jgi:putative membrane protein
MIPGGIFLAMQALRPWRRRNAEREVTARCLLAASGADCRRAANARHWPHGGTMIRVLAAWLTNCLALLIAAAVIPQISYGGDVGTLLLAGLILGVVNLVVRPAVILLTLPAVILSFGLALLAINALMLWLTSRLVDGFSVGGFFSTLGGALIVWVVNAALRRRGHPRGRRPWPRRAVDRGQPVLPRR